MLLSLRLYAALLCLLVSTHHLSCAPDKETIPAPPPLAGIQAPSFTDVTDAAGIHFRHRSGGRIKNYIVEAKGGGGAFLDYDGDGFLDIYLVNGSRFGAYPDTVVAPANALYKNQGNGTFADITTPSGTGDQGWGMGCVVGDYDNDNDQDIFVSNYGPNTLYQNRANGTFVESATRAGVALAGWSTGAALGDGDNDGDLDLYVAQYIRFDPAATPPRAGMWKGVQVFAGPLGLPAAADAYYQNQGDGTFVDASTSAGFSASTPWYGLGAVFGDYDDDGDLDLFVANDSAPNFLYQNQGNGTFADLGPSAGVAFGESGNLQAGMGIAYGDYNNDNRRDFFVTHFEDDYNTLYQNQGDGTFTVASFAAGLGQPSQPLLGFGTCFLDYDNDADQDLLVANGHVYPQMRHLRDNGDAEPNQLFINQGPSQDYRYTLAQSAALAQTAISRGACWGDYDNDGDQDLLVLNLEGPPHLLRNDGGNQRHWLNLRLKGTRSNRDGIGAKVRAVTGATQQTIEITAGGSFLSHNDTRAHFGLGPHPVVDLLEIRWPSGQIQRLEDVAANQFMTVEEP